MKLRSLRVLIAREDDPQKIDWPALVVLLLYVGLAVMLLVGIMVAPQMFAS